MRKSRKISRLSKKYSDDDKIHAIYLATYKKYKYWISAYYIVTIIVLLLLSKYDSWPILESMPLETRVIQYGDFVTTIAEVPKQTKLKDVIDRQLEFNVATSPWDEIKQRANSYLNDTEKFLTHLCEKADTSLISKKNQIIEGDREIIFAGIAKRDSVIAKRNETDQSLDKSQLQNIVKREKRDFILNTNISLAANHSLFLSNKFKQELYDTFGVSERELDLSIEQYEARDALYSEKQKELDQFLSDEGLTANIANISTQNKYILLVSHPLLLVILFYTTLLYFHYKSYDNHFKQKKENKLIYAPAISQIAAEYNLGPKITSFFAILFNLVFPVAVSGLLLFRLRIVLEKFNVVAFYYSGDLLVLGLIIVCIAKNRSLLKDKSTEGPA